MDTPSIVITHRFPYRGQNEDWSNKYHFLGTTPSSDAAWKTLADAIIAQEKLCLGNENTYVGAIGYHEGQAHAVWSHDYTLDGGSPVTGTQNGPFAQGDSCVVIRGKTAKKSSKGKPVYGYKYLHGVHVDTSNPDQVAGAALSLVNAYGAKLIDGSLPGGFKWCLPQGEPVTSAVCNPFMTIHQLKARGKRGNH